MQRVREIERMVREVMAERRRNEPVRIQGFDTSLAPEDDIDSMLDDTLDVSAIERADDEQVGSGGEDGDDISGEVALATNREAVELRL